MDSQSRSRWRMRLYLFLAGVKRHLTLGTRVMMIRDEEVYLVRHTYTPGWHFPGGGVEPGESAAAAAAREVSEESAYRLTELPKLFGLYHSTLASNRDHVALFVCREFEAEHSFRANFEIAEFGWFPIDRLPEGTSAATRRRIAEVLEGTPQTDSW